MTGASVKLLGIKRAFEIYTVRKRDSF